jgi:hypothetical protein
VTDVVVEQAIPLSDSISSTSDPLTLIYPSYDVVVEQAIPVSADTLVAFNVLYFLHSETTHPVQDCKDSLNTVLRRYYKEDVPVADWLPLPNFVYVPLPDVDDGRVLFNTPTPVFAFAGTYTPATSFTLTAVDTVAVERNPVTYQAPVYQWQGVVTLHDFAIYHAGMLLGETESRFQRALRLGVEFRGEKLTAVATLLLGTSHGAVGGANQFVGVDPVVRGNRQPDAGGHEDFMAAQDEWFRQALAQPFGNAYCILNVVGAAQQDRKFVAAGAGQQIGFVQRLRQASADIAQQLVPQQWAERFVDGAKAIQAELHDQNRHHFLMLLVV